MKEDVSSQNACVNPIENQRQEALRHYNELATRCHHWSSFVEHAIKAYNPSTGMKEETIKAEVPTPEAPISFGEFIKKKSNGRFFTTELYVIAEWQKEYALQQQPAMGDWSDKDLKGAFLDGVQMKTNFPERFGGIKKDLAEAKLYMETVSPHPPISPSDAVAEEKWITQADAMAMIEMADKDYTESVCIDFAEWIEQKSWVALPYGGWITGKQELSSTTELYNLYKNQK